MSSSLTVSFDFELGWGVLESDLWKVREDLQVYARTKGSILRVISKLRDLQLPTTWATVSSLFVETESDLQVEHLPEKYRSDCLRFYRDSAFDTRCALDIVDSLNELFTFSELASHTATHIYALHPEIDSAAYIEDVRVSKCALQRVFDRPVKSLVFPRDQTQFSCGVSKDLGMAYRVGPYEGQPARSRFIRVRDGGMSFVRGVPESKVFVDEFGNCSQSGSLYFNALGGSYESVKKKLLKVQCARLLRQLERGEGSFHVWLHPFNLGESSNQLQDFCDFVEAVARLRDRGLVDVVTMSDRAGTSCIEESVSSDQAPEVA